MSSRRELLRRGAGLLAVGSTASAGALAALSNADGGAGRDRGDTSDSTRSADVLVAGSLQQVAGEVGDASVEAHGSVACRRLIEDGLRDPDAAALADPELFDGLAERVTCFATNALVVAVRDGLADRYDDWRALVADDALSLGRTDPARDPLGYRTVMALELAEGIDAAAVLDRIDVFPETGLLRTLEAGGIDAAFAYRSMAVEHDLSHLDLPDRIDFSNPDLADEYAAASVELPDRTVRGAPIRYAASGRTSRGHEWVRRLGAARETLRNAGFGVPEAYPRRREVDEK
ncbi:substrate-binding domain-containing protein [Halorussus gelatinilyticus]|uniref:Substrate-binding domain-containing protein n=1 Tax=Halorussus gelatinilyticus TaxID=2937524 RepID=A0A8U0IHE1_9EURY|nr:substrate-binding domain-containing protein [Halorussus gelatinilyticus]UPW00106.1 substrate-binding domain-containing protein [Halorussus gelatinilyticus]